MLSFNDEIKYVGVDDDNLDLFEAQYPLLRGISYNSWLIDGDSDGQGAAGVAVVDSVDSRRTEQWLRRVEAELAGRAPGWLIVQHMEPDHSGSIRAFVDRYPSAKVVCTAKAAAMLANFFEDADWSGRVVTVGDGDSLSVGAASLRFITAPMVHWPEVMMTFDETHGVLFSADAFGSFAMGDAAVAEAWPDEARRYYSNIVGKYGASVQTVMHKLKSLSFSVIAPLHGPALSGDLAPYWRLYDLWSRYQPEEPDGVLVAYASIYGGTAEAARRIAEILDSLVDGPVVPMDLCRHDVSEAVSQAFRMGRLVLASVTYDAALYPAMFNFLHHLQLKGFRGRRIALVENGSWAPQAARLMTDMLSGMLGMTVVEPRLSIRSRLHKADCGTLQALAEALAR